MTFYFKRLTPSSAAGKSGAHFCDSKNRDTFGSLLDELVRVLLTIAYEGKNYYHQSAVYQAPALQRAHTLLRY